MKWLVPQRQKLVHFLQEQLEPSPSGKQLRKVLDANLCRVNGCVERFGTAEVEKGSVVELAPAWASVSQSSLNRFETIFEDDHFLVVDKPEGWVCTDDECQKAFGPKRYLVHRLDKETTGLLLIAKSHGSRDVLIKLFADRQIEKLYIALVDGIPKEERGARQTYFAKIGSFEGQSLWGSRAKGLYAETHWKVFAKGNDASLILCQPMTGRTHQIRVHLSEIGHPILVDRQYAERFRCKYFAKRILLHASRLRFRHPVTGAALDFKAPLHEDMGHAIHTLIDEADEAIKTF
jgi:23S rRNA pseudouridine955/2504/2580 synthase/23S rRNA pseudouridine1911/1915/1917 synthase